ncbi:MAG: DVUA0089 family protein [Sandaracinaceae bacterium]
MKHRSILFALIALLGGCVASAGGKGAPPDLAAGKADGTIEIVDNGPLAFGDTVTSDVQEGLAQQWSFTLSGAASVELRTGPGEAGETDTILYLYDADGERAVDDDGGEGLLSQLVVELEAGEYKVTVVGYGSAAGDFSLASVCRGEGCGEVTEPTEPTGDPYAAARDVHTMRVDLSAAPVPEYYSRPEGISPVSLSQPEWWQRWSGGATQSFAWDEGTDNGKRCGQASAIRLQAIMEYEETGEDGVVHRPGQEAFDALREGSGWSGTMYNWTEDVSEGGSASFSPATMWAWRTGAVKFINVVRPDGSCDLPTLDLVLRFSATCLVRAACSKGEIPGCRACGR